jgi:hypothetical protein
MLDLLNRFSFSAAKFDSATMAILVIVWLLVLTCAVSSIRSQSFNRRQLWFWILIIVCLPGVGLLCYLPFSLGKDSPGKLYRGEHRK